MAQANWFYSFAERSLELRDGEKPFSTKMSNAFFDLGYAPLRGGHRIEDVDSMLEEDTGISRILVNLKRTARNGETTDLTVATSAFHDPQEASGLAAAMNGAGNLSRANRALEAANPILANLGNMSLQASAAPALAVVVTRGIVERLF